MSSFSSGWYEGSCHATLENLGETFTSLVASSLSLSGNVESLTREGHSPFGGAMVWLSFAAAVGATTRGFVVCE